MQTGFFVEPILLAPRDPSEAVVRFWLPIRREAADQEDAPKTNTANRDMLLRSICY